MKISSPAFENNASIPIKYTCEGENINPAIEFKDVPTGTKSLALLMDDPDVPKNLKPDGVFDHWVVFNMPPETSGIAENSTAPGVTGKNSAGQNKYTGPCPPDREHRYFFRLYALDTMLNLDQNATKEDVLKATEGHILEQSELVGKYNKLANQR
jgi:Raf kinase inhibitor-like YbhB/YbcL family protein